jgi:hypothetical protein
MAFYGRPLATKADLARSKARAKRLRREQARREFVRRFSRKRLGRGYTDKA